MTALKVLLLAESDRPCVTVYRRRREGGFGVEEHGGPEGVVDLSEIGASLPLAELYEGIAFA